MAKKRTTKKPINKKNTASKGPSKPVKPAKRTIVGDWELAAHYGVTTKSVYNWRRDGMPAVELPGNKWEYDLDLTDPWVLPRRDTAEADEDCKDAKKRKVLADARRAEAEANLKEREDELKEGNILDRSYYELFSSELIQEARDAILRVPAFFHNHLCKKCQHKIAELKTQLETALRGLARLKEGPDEDA